MTGGGAHRVLVVGGANLDQTAITSRLPGRGETLLASGYRETPGGKAANLACAAADWGAPVSFVGRVGDDGFGRTLLDAWREAGVDATHVQRDPEGTGLGLVFMDDDGHYQTVVVPRANGRLDAADVEALPATLWREVGAVALALEAPAGATLAAALAAADRGLPLLLNAAPAEGMDDRLWPAVSHLIVNEHEAALLSGVEVVDATTAGAAASRLLGRLLPKRAAAVVVTLGAQGAVWLGRDGVAHTAAAPSVTVVDTLGAGDTFVGVLAAELASGRELGAAVAAACRAGAVAVTVPGARARVTRASAAGAGWRSVATSAAEPPEGAVA